MAAAPLGASVPLADDSAVDDLCRIVDAVLATTRRTLTARYGWTLVRVSASVDPRAHRVALDGEVLVPAIATALAVSLRAVLPAPWTALLRCTVPEGTHWRAVPSDGVRLTRGIPDAGRRHELATTLTAADGPVRVLARRRGAALVRALDGTLGWTTRPLGPLCAPPRPRAVRPDPAALARVLRSYLGVPYQLGGTTQSGLDCSGLVQRTLRQSGHPLVPRHSTDQMTLGGTPVRPLGEPGDLVFIWTPSEPSPHVGVVLRGGRPWERRVVHASTTRRRVAEDPLDRFVATAARVAHVEYAQVLDAPACPRLR